MRGIDELVAASSADDARADAPGDGSQATLPTRRRPVSAKRLRRAAVVGGVVVVILVVLGIAYSAVAWQRVDRFHVELPGSPGGGTTFLLIGNDSRAFVASAEDRAHYGTPGLVPGERADVVLLVRTVGDDVKVLELPRDRVVLSANRGLVELALTLVDGPQSTVDSLCRTLGLGVDHVVVLDFAGLTAIVDAVGGVDVSTDAPLRDRVSGLNLATAGRHHLDGSDALAFVRARTLEQRTEDGWTPVPSDAADRNTRARTTLQEVGNRMDLSPVHPFASHSRVWAVAGALKIDDTMGVRDAWRLKRALGRLATASTLTIPVRPRGGAVPSKMLDRESEATLRAFDGGPAANEQCEAL